MAALMCVAKNVVITGASRGIGRSLAEEFLKHGHRVVLSSKSAYTTIKVYKELRRIYGDACMYYIADVGDHQQCVALAHASKCMLGDIDLWVNNAGSTAYKRGNVTELSAKEIENIVHTNYLGAIFACIAAIRVMEKGTIINFEGSGSNSPSVPGYSVYSSSKTGLSSFSKSIREELKDTNINVCTVSPGLVYTDLLTQGNSPTIMQRIKPMSITPDQSAKFIYKEIIAKGEYAERIEYLTFCRLVFLLLVYPIRYFVASSAIKRK